MSQDLHRKITVARLSGRLDDAAELLRAHGASLCAEYQAQGLSHAVELLTAALAEANPPPPPNGEPSEDVDAGAPQGEDGQSAESAPPDKEVREALELAWLLDALAHVEQLRAAAASNARSALAEEPETPCTPETPGSPQTPPSPAATPSTPMSAMSQGGFSQDPTVLTELGLILRKACLQNRPQDQSLKVLVARSLSALAQLYHASNQQDKADAAHIQALELFDQIPLRAPSSPSVPSAAQDADSSTPRDSSAPSTPHPPQSPGSPQSPAGDSHEQIGQWAQQSENAQDASRASPVGHFSPLGSSHIPAADFAPPPPAPGAEAHDTPTSKLGVSEEGPEFREWRSFLESRLAQVEASLRETILSTSQQNPATLLSPQAVDAALAAVGQTDQASSRFLAAAATGDSANGTDPSSEAHNANNSERAATHSRRPTIGVHSLKPDGWDSSNELSKQGKGSKNAAPMLRRNNSTDSGAAPGQGSFYQTDTSSQPRFRLVLVRRPVSVDLEQQMELIRPFDMQPETTTNAAPATRSESKASGSPRVAPSRDGVPVAKADELCNGPRRAAAKALDLVKEHVPVQICLDPRDQDVVHFGRQTYEDAFVFLASRIASSRPTQRRIGYVRLDSSATDLQISRRHAQIKFSRIHKLVASQDNCADAPGRDSPPSRESGSPVPFSARDAESRLLPNQELAWVIRDLDSTNGVLVNGVRIQEHPLRHGDIVAFGGGHHINFGCAVVTHRRRPADSVFLYRFEEVAAVSPQPLLRADLPLLAGDKGTAASHLAPYFHAFCRFGPASADRLDRLHFFLLFASAHAALHPDKAAHFRNVMDASWAIADEGAQLVRSSMNLFSEAAEAGVPFTHWQPWLRSRLAGTPN